MAKKFVRTVVSSALLLAALPAVAGETPSAPDIMFERTHLESLKAGQTVNYRFQRTVSEPKLLGQPYSDDISLVIDKVTDDGKWDVNLLMFTGERSRGDNRVQGMTGNPLLVLYLDRAVSNYSMLAGGKRGYLKNRFRIGLREDAKVEPAKMSYGGKEVDGYRITVAPYAKDLNKEKMRGYENSRFEILLSEAVPGHFVEFVSIFESTEKNSPRLEERITVVTKEAKK